MLCPFCSATTKIYNSRSTHGKTQTWRRHRCSSCKKVFTTRERIDWDNTTTVKNSEGSTPYSRERLLLSLVKASQNLILPSGMLTELVDSIEQNLQTDQFFAQSDPDVQIITELTTTVLHRYKPNLALQYVNIVFRNNPPPSLVKRLLAD